MSCKNRLYTPTKAPQNRWGGQAPLEIIQFPAQSRVSCSTLLRAVSSWDLNSSKDGTSTASLGSLCRCSTSLTVKVIFPMFKWDFIYLSLCSLLLILVNGHHCEEAGSIFFTSPARCLYTRIRSPKPSHLQAEQHHISASLHVTDVPIP